LKFSDKELLLFDFDGTLIDSVPDLALAVNHTLVSIDRPTFDEDIIRLWVGNGAQTLVKRALSGDREIAKDIDEVLFEKALGIFLEFYANNVCVNTTLYSGVKATLQELKKLGYRMSIVTNKPYDFIEPILIGLDLENIFELWIGADSLKLKKPNPEPLIYICEKCDVDIEQSLMIGDSKNDILAAKAAKMDSVGVSYGYNYGEDIKEYKPEIVIDDIEELVKILA